MTSLPLGGGQNPTGVDNDFVNLFFVDILSLFMLSARAGSSDWSNCFDEGAFCHRRSLNISVSFFLHGYGVTIRAALHSWSW